MRTAIGKTAHMTEAIPDVCVRLRRVGRDRVSALCAWPRNRVTVGHIYSLEATMPKYLLEVNYTLDGVRGVLSQGGTARQAAAQAAAESVGGTLESFFFAFGGTDVYVIADMPTRSQQPRSLWRSRQVAGLR
jgi:uncharacterized protein with GYD domain